MAEPKKLYLSQTDKKISGLCGGIADYFGTDPTMVRLGWVIITLISGIIPGLIGYIIGIMVVPKPPEVTSK